MAIINQDWISKGMNECTTITAYVKNSVDYNTIKNHFVGIKFSTASPEIDTSTSATPVGVVLDKLPDTTDPWFPEKHPSSNTTYMVRLQVAGIAKVNYSGDFPTVGSYVQFGPDGKGGLKKVTSGGQLYLVVGASIVSQTMWIVL